MASPVPLPSYVVLGGATDAHVVNIVDDAPTTVYEIAGIVGATYEPSADHLHPKPRLPADGPGA
jgi:UDP-glucose 4-epimerase